MARLSGMKQITEFVGYSETTVLDWIRVYQFPACKIGGSWISESSLIDQWWVKVITGEIDRPSGVSSQKIKKRPQLNLNYR